MKDTTGEMLTTIIVIIGLVAVMGLFSSFIWPTIRNTIKDKTNSINNTNLTTYIVENYNI